MNTSRSQVRRFAFILLAVITLTSGFASMVAAHPSAPYTVSPDQAAAICQELRDEGILDQLDRTTGQCVNDLIGPSSELAFNYISSFCAREVYQQIIEVSNRGQCIRFQHEYFAH
jgi:hypothetical protein